METLVHNLIASGAFGKNASPSMVAAIVVFIMSAVVFLGVAFPFAGIVSWAERRVWARIQSRVGPNRVGPQGFLQWLADGVKHVCKEDIIPDESDAPLFKMAPYLVMLAFTLPWAVMPFSSSLILADLNVGILYMTSVTALTVVGVLMAAGSLNLGAIVARQHGGALAWNWFWLLPLLVVYFISGVAETNRAPFDVAEGESEIVAGFHVEYSGMAFALFFLAEYANMILIAGLTAVFFFGGWLSPLDGFPWWLGGTSLLAIPGTHWLVVKIFVLLFLFLWLRATFPRYRYDQIMRLGWKFLIPVTLVWIAVEALMSWYHVGPWKLA